MKPPLSEFRVHIVIQDEHLASVNSFWVCSEESDTRKSLDDFVTEIRFLLDSDPEFILL